MRFINSRSAHIWLIAFVSALLACLVVGLGGALASPPDILALVTLQPLADQQAAQTLVTADGGRLLEQLKPLSVYRVAFAAGSADVDLDALRARTDLIKGADLDSDLDAQIVPDDPLYKQFQWNLRRIGMESTWDLRPERGGCHRRRAGHGCRFDAPGPDGQSAHRPGL